jgi:hypothetical protein
LFPREQLDIQRSDAAAGDCLIAHRRRERNQPALESKPTRPRAVQRYRVVSSTSAGIPVRPVLQAARSAFSPWHARCNIYPVG